VVVSEESRAETRRSQSRATRVLAMVLGHIHVTSIALHVGIHGTWHAWAQVGWREAERFVQRSEKVIHGTAVLKLLLALGRHLTVTCLDAIFLHCQRAIHIVKFVVESTGVADRVSVMISSPKCRRARPAVRTTGARPSGCRIYQSSLRFDEGSVCSVHLVIKSTRVTQVVASTISSPQRCRRSTTIHTLSAF
jgi:hypothetical protein